MDPGAEEQHKEVEVNEVTKAVKVPTANPANSSTEPETSSISGDAESSKPKNEDKKPEEEISENPAESKVEETTKQEPSNQSKPQPPKPSNNSTHAKPEQSAYCKSPTQELEKINRSYPKPPASRQSIKSTGSSMGSRLTFRKMRSDGSEQSEITEKASADEPWKYSFNHMTSRLHPLGRPQIPYDAGVDGSFHRSFVNINATLRTPKLRVYDARKEVYAKEKVDRSPMVSRILTTIASYEKARDIRELRFRYQRTLRRPRSNGWPNLATPARQSVH